MSNIAAAVVTTFPDVNWKVYAEVMLTNFVSYWPAEIPILIHLDDNLLENDVKKISRPQDGVVCGMTPEQAAFVERNKGKDDDSDYRKQAVRFCHKVFALKFACDSAVQARKAGALDAPRYLIWIDADVITTSKVTFDDIAKCLPKDYDSVAYLGRKDWPHSECGWLAFDLDNKGNDLIDAVYEMYVNDAVLKQDQWHDSWIFDVAMKKGFFNGTNLTLDKPGREIWQHSPMAKFSIHHKGPVAKDMLAGKKPRQDKNMPLKIQTKNSLPNASIQRNILENQIQIKNWINECLPHDEEIVVVSAGPMLVAEDLAEEVKGGRKIVAVKHALEPLKAAGIKPWACVLLDPREHVSEFVKHPDKEVIWFVASQVSPAVVRSLLEADCNVWGYHAAVGAEEDNLTDRQPGAVIRGGSATATRGLFVFDRLGFRKFRLYGYDLCLPDKPDLGAKDDIGQPNSFEVAIKAEKKHYALTRAFWSSGELLAQYQEMVDIIERQPWDIKAYGHGIVPFLVQAKRTSDLREARKKAKLNIHIPVSYKELLECNKKRNFLANWLHLQLKNLLKPRKDTLSSVA